jgi:hypothetical protein
MRGGWRTIAPYLRGSGPTRFLSDETPRVGAGLALAQDAVDLADRLSLDRFAIVGHDWGARPPTQSRPCFQNDGGAAEVQAKPLEFARIQWETWSPPGWFTAADLAKATESFSNPDWVLITLNAYRSRSREGEAWDREAPAAAAAAILSHLGSRE